MKKITLLLTGLLFSTQAFAKISDKSSDKLIFNIGLSEFFPVYSDINPGGGFVKYDVPESFKMPSNYFKNIDVGVTYFFDNNLAIGVRTNRLYNRHLKKPGTYILDSGKEYQKVEVKTKAIHD